MTLNPLIIYLVSTYLKTLEPMVLAQYQGFSEMVLQLHLMAEAKATVPNK